MPGQQVRFTPEELKELAPQLTPEDLMKMHPDDRKVALQFADIAQGPDGNLHKIDPNGAYKALGAMGAGLAGAAGAGAGVLGKVASSVIPYGKMAGVGAASGLGGIGAMKLAEYLGASKSTSDLIPMMMLMAMGGRGGAGKAAAAEAGSLMSAEEAALAARMEKQGFKPDLIEKTIARSRMTQAAAPEKGSSGASLGLRKPSQVSTQDAMDAENRVFGNQANAAEARTFGASPRSPYPPNVSTESNTDDLMEMITRSSSTGQPSPLMVHGDDELKRAINEIKKLSRRSPQ